MTFTSPLTREAWQAATHHDQQEEAAVTAPAQPSQISIFGDLADILGRLSGRMLALGGNRLITRLAAAGLGAHLADDDIEHVLAIVAAIESARDGCQPMPRRVPSADPAQPQVTA